MKRKKEKKHWQFVHVVLLQPAVNSSLEQSTDACMCLCHTVYMTYLLYVQHKELKR